MIKKIEHNDKLLAIIVPRNFEKDGIDFFTPDHFTQQLGYMKRPKNYVIQPHIHKPARREVQYTKEVLLIKKGKVRVDFYDVNKIYLESTVLEAGDVILLAFGGHGFEMIEDSEIIEIKQGPYVEAQDKERFDPIEKGNLKIKS